MDVSPNLKVPKLLFEVGIMKVWLVRPQQRMVGCYFRISHLGVCRMAAGVGVFFRVDEDLLKVPGVAEE
jgi:hypothetical protein